MAANVYLEDVVSSVSTMNAIVKEVVWGMVQLVVIQKEAPHGDDDGDGDGDGYGYGGDDGDDGGGDDSDNDDNDGEKVEMRNEMLQWGLPMSFGHPKASSKIRRNNKKCQTNKHIGIIYFAHIYMYLLG